MSHRSDCGYQWNCCAHAWKGESCVGRFQRDFQEAIFVFLQTETGLFLIWPYSDISDAVFTVVTRGLCRWFWKESIDEESYSFRTPKADTHKAISRCDSLQQVAATVSATSRSKCAVSKTISYDKTLAPAHAPQWFQIGGNVNFFFNSTWRTYSKRQRKRSF